MNKFFLIIALLFLSISVFAQQQVESSNHGVANARVGDFIIRSNGQRVILNQGDIDHARRQLGMNTNQNNRTTPSSTDTSTSNSFLWGRYDGPVTNLIIFLPIMGILTLIVRFIGSLLSLIPYIGIILNILTTIAIVAFWIGLIFYFGFIYILGTFVIIAILGFLIGQPDLVIRAGGVDIGVWFK